MENVDVMGETKLRITWDYVMKLKEKLKEVTESDTIWCDHDIRKLKQRIKMLEKHLSKR